MDVWINTTREDQHALRIDHSGTSRGGQVPPNFSDGAVANSYVAFCPSDSGNDETIANDELRRLLRGHACRQHK